MKKLSPIEKKNVLPRIPRRVEASDNQQQGTTKQHNNLTLSRQATIAGINRQKPVQGPPADLGSRQATVTGITRHPQLKREKGASCSNFMIDDANYAKFSRYVNLRLGRTRRLNLHSSNSRRSRDNVLMDLDQLTNSQSNFQDKYTGGAAGQRKEDKKWKY